MLDLKTADWHGYNQTYNVKKILQQISGNFRKDWNKFPETHNPSYMHDIKVKCKEVSHPIY